MKILVFIKQSVIVATSCVLVSSCATVEEDSGLGKDIDFSGSDCISIRTIRDYTPLDRSTLLIEGSGKRNYLVTLAGPSFELRSSFRLGFSSRDGWLCPYGGDRLVLGGLSNEEVMIRGVSRITADQADELLLRYGKKMPEEQPDQAPPDVTGAEVEELGQIG